MQAREIVRYAKRNGLTLMRGGVGNTNKTHCARSVVYHMAFGPKNQGQYSIYFKRLPASMGVSEHQIESLERGFEYTNPIRVKGYDKRYYKMGQNVARLVGLA